MWDHRTVFFFCFCFSIAIILVFARFDHQPLCSPRKVCFQSCVPFCSQARRRGGGGRLRPYPVMSLGQGFPFLNSKQ